MMQTLDVMMCTFTYTHNSVINKNSNMKYFIGQKQRKCLNGEDGYPGARVLKLHTQSLFVHILEQYTKTAHLGRGKIGG